MIPVETPALASIDTAVPGYAPAALAIDPADIADPALRGVAEKVASGRRLDFDDGMALWNSRDIFTIGALANAVRESMHGRIAYYNINRHINYSNICALQWSGAH